MTHSTVVNLISGKTLVVSNLPPEKAVVYAFYQESGRLDAMKYDYSRAVISKSGLTVSCGDWIALIPQPEKDYMQTCCDHLQVCREFNKEFDRLYGIKE